jgi:hypothetical protein
MHRIGLARGRGSGDMTRLLLAVVAVLAAAGVVSGAEWDV